MIQSQLRHTDQATDQYVRRAFAPRRPDGRSCPCNSALLEVVSEMPVGLVPTLSCKPTVSPNPPSPLRGEGGWGEGWSFFEGSCKDSYKSANKGPLDGSLKAQL